MRYTVYLQELLSGRAALSGGVELTDLLASGQKNLLLVLTSIEKYGSVLILDLVRDDFAQAAALGWIDVVSCLPAFLAD